MNDHFNGIRYERLDDGIPSGEPPSAAVRGDAEGGHGLWPLPAQSHRLSPSLASIPPSPSGVSSQGDVRPSTAGGRKPVYSAKSGINQRETRARQHTWTVVSSSGEMRTVRDDKRGIIQKFRLGVPIRDMRLLDPALLTSETGKILVRDNAIVFSMEHVRLIITADEVIYPQLSHNALATHFSLHLAEALKEAAELAVQMNAHQDEDTASEGSRHEVAALPFELQVLEVALRDVSEMATRLSKELEGIAHPALDTLTKHVTTSNLERVRKVKTRHQRLLSRVQTIREELQRFLEDDDDMAKMCLTRKRFLERAAASSGQLPSMQHAQSMQHAHSGSINRRASISLTNRLLTPGGTSPPPEHLESPHCQGNPPGKFEFEEDSESIDAVENLLESYFMQVDSAYDRLVSVGEYIKDTEEYINIELDSSRNRLIRLEIVLTAGTFAVGIFACVAGILGENLIIPPAITKNIMGFVSVNAITLAICLLFFAAIMGYIRWRRLL